MALTAGASAEAANSGPFSSPTAETLYGLAQAFMHMIRHLKGERLDEWLVLVKASQIPEVQSLVRSIKKDRAAILAGLTLQHNNGVMEGKVNKLKLIKRMMFGRAQDLRCCASASSMHCRDEQEP